MGRKGVISEEQVNWICDGQPKPAVINANIKAHYDHWPIRHYYFSQWYSHGKFC